MTRQEIPDEDKNEAYQSSEESNSSDSPLEALSDDGETSSSGSSSDETDSDGDEEDSGDRPSADRNLPSHLPNVDTSPTALKSRLAAFIPQLQKANAELETDPDVAAKRIDDVDDNEEQYIEMNLGLGVLKEQPAAGTAKGLRTAISEDSDLSSDDSVSDDEVEPETTEISVVDKLKGVKPTKRKIEEVG